MSPWATIDNLGQTKKETGVMRGIKRPGRREKKTRSQGKKRKALTFKEKKRHRSKGGDTCEKKHRRKEGRCWGRKIPQGALHDRPAKKRKDGNGKLQQQKKVHPVRDTEEGVNARAPSFLHKRTGIKGGKSWTRGLLTPSYPIHETGE